MRPSSLHPCQPSRQSRARSAGSVWTCTQCGTGWHIRENGRWGRDGHELLIEVPRLDKRFSLERCRADAQMAARSEGFSGPPDEVASYDGTPTAVGGPLANPQGYVFTWYAPGSEEVPLTAL